MSTGLRASIAVVLISTAAVVAWLATRRSSSGARPQQAGHSAMVGGGDSAKPVHLTRQEASRIGVTYAPVAYTPLHREIRSVGQVSFDETRQRAISSRVDGFVERLYVNFTGQSVRQGEPLLTIYSPMVVAAQEELLLAKRLQRDVTQGNAEARRNADDLVESARRRLMSWNVLPDEIVEIERMGEVHRTVTLRATAGGVVIAKNVLEGQRVMAGDALYTVADVSTVWIEGEVFEQDMPSVHLGVRAIAEFQSLPGAQREGRITYVYATLNPETRTFRVRAAFSNPGVALKPGMYATLRLVHDEPDKVLSVPRSAVLSTGERNLVFVRRDDGELEPRDVTLGATSDDRTQVLSGLAPGELVVSSATFLVDAESNLGAALGGMGNMPGMDVSVPPKDARQAGAPSRGTSDSAMRGMDHTKPKR
jgi:membrane fusion protein, copper/silver efflux system